MDSLTDLREVVDVVIGVDTHVHTHSAAVLDTATGGVLDEVTVEATAQGYAELVEFANQHATLRAWAIEGTSGHGAGLSRHLLASSEFVIELDRPKRAARRNGAKSDPLDAIRAAREAMARPRVGTPRAGGDRQALSVLLAARRSAINASTDAQLQAFSLVVAAPEPIRARFRGQKLAAMLNTAAKLRVHPTWDTETTSTVVALRALARRVHALLNEARAHQKAIVTIIRGWRPDLLEQFGVGPIVAATVLCAWSHPGRIQSEAAFAMLAGVAPIPANSGQVTTRHRLNRYGDRHLNQALHTVVRIRIQYQPATRDYVARRTAEGKTQPRDQTLPHPLRRTRPLPPTRKRGRSCLTKHRSVAPTWLRVDRSCGAAKQGGLVVLGECDPRTRCAGRGSSAGARRGGAAAAMPAWFTFTTKRWRSQGKRALHPAQ